MKNKLLKKIQDKTLTIGVVGLGYVGLPLAVEKAKAGFKTIGFDVQEEKVDMVNRGENYIGDVIVDDLKEVVDNGLLSATTDFSFVKDVDFIAICVPTPLDSFKQPDITYVKSSTEAISKYLKPETMVVLESTTYPGTTEELLMPILESSGLKCGKDFYLGYSPERVDPGNLVYKTKNTPKVVGGVGKDATDVIAKVYETVLNSDIHKVSSPKIAEMEKILENTYRNINIGLANEMALICHRMGINVWEVIDAAKSKPYGFQAFYPGPGLGGHCIPLDPFYLSWKAREFNYHMKLIETSGEINDYMPEYVLERCSKILNRNKKPLNGAKILICGVAYKQDIDDYRESPALTVIDNFEKEMSEISYYDPYIPNYKYHGVERKSIKNLENLQEFDIIVVTTSHTTVDYEKIANAGVPVFDSKNVMINVKNRENIEVL
ncbi:MAG: nucleotide sugar dehydrogenase [Clostridia bacterium]